ncbi:uncharacterized protein LOC122510821 [Leptopilina heterotoma]|uniref:uncharacterized protein LOC122510821 n=1 Tax=Leptopilina heterotoma TaxID=63436 RepID=UPI001CAA1296|nr:uncharacterized protein LOC122510821 [Leptopilina heterotoma]
MEPSRNQLYLNWQSPVTYNPFVNQTKMYSTMNSTKSPIEKMHSKQALNMHSPTIVVTPKKGNIFQNMYNSLATIFVDQLAKVPTTLINHFTNVNNSLSVTIVPNEGIISHEFFKTLTGQKDQLSENMYIQCIQNKESSIDFIDTMKLSNKVHIPKDEFLGNTNDSKFPILDDFDLCLDLEPMFLYEKAFDNNHHTNRTVMNDKKKSSEINMETIDDKIIPEDEIIIKNKVELYQNTKLSKNSSNDKLQLTENNSFSNMWNAVISGVTDHFRSFSPAQKNNNNQHQSKNRRKANCVSSGRGRGRGKSQLRRNGVSQSRHRKERGKHQIFTDIQDDFDTWEEFESYTEPFNCLGYEDNNDDNDNNGDADNIDTMITIENPSYTLNFELIDFKPKKMKQKKNILVKTDSFSMKVKFVPECSLEEREATCTVDKTAFRPRLISEASVDSEDSYIVFQTGDDSDFDCSDETETSDSDTDTESETDDEPLKNRVRFNLNPTIHKMVKWDFAYRAARLGPWEEMARDRERFKDRIYSIGRILEPVLSSHVRTQIWNERFAPKEESL